MSEKLERYAAQLRKVIERHDELIEDTRELLRIHQEWEITDDVGAEELREDLQRLENRRERDRSYLRKVEEMLAS